MLAAQFDGDVLVLQPDGPITRADVAKLTRVVDEYLAGHATIAGVMVETPAFPGYAELAAFADHAHFVAAHHARVQRIAIVTDSTLAPFAEFVANHVVGVEMRHFAFTERSAAMAWLRAR
jgi:hypothetical protein